MNEPVFSDDALRRAAAKVRQSMLDALPDPEECNYEVTPEFQKKMNRLFAKVKHRKAVRQIERRVAAILLASLIGVSSWLAVDHEARAAFIQWAREVYEDSVIYRFFNEPDDSVLPEYTFSPVPDGYTETTSVSDDTMRAVVFEGNNDILVLYYEQYHSGLALGVLGSDFEMETANVGPYPADFYRAPNPEESNELVWIDETVGVVFKISSFRDKDAILEFANHIQTK